jgi:hypothetical protein
MDMACVMKRKLSSLQPLNLRVHTEPMAEVLSAQNARSLAQ